MYRLRGWLLAGRTRPPSLPPFLPKPDKVFIKVRWGHPPFYSLCIGALPFPLLMAWKKWRRGKRPVFLKKKKREILKCAQEDNQSVAFFCLKMCLQIKRSDRPAYGRGKGQMTSKPSSQSGNISSFVFPEQLQSKKEIKKSASPLVPFVPHTGRLKMIFATGGCGNSGGGGLGL